MRKLLVSLLVAAGASLGSAHAADFTAMSWDQIVAEGKKEGEITWYNWYKQPELRTSVKAFEAEYGIKVTIPDGDNDGNFNKFLAARDSAQGDIDVISIGDNAMLKIKPADFLIGDLPKILPGADKLHFDIGLGKSEGHGVAFWGNQTGLAYNPAILGDQPLPQTVAELSAFMEKNPGLVGWNVTNGGAGPALVQSIVRDLVPDVDYQNGTADEATKAKLQAGYDWFKARKAQFVITASIADSLTRLNGGEFAIVAAWEDHLAGLQKKGDLSKDLKFYIPAFKMPGGGNFAGIPKNAKHPAAALVFLHWLTSAATQTDFNKVYGIAPQNADASSEFALVTSDQRVNGTKWLNAPLGDEVKKQFTEQVTLN